MINQSKIDVGENIKHIRELKNLKQDYVAKETDMQQAAICKIEKSGNDVTAEEMIKIAAALEVHPGVFLNFNVEEAIRNATPGLNATGGNVDQQLLLHALKEQRRLASEMQRLTEIIVYLKESQAKK